MRREKSLRIGVHHAKAEDAPGEEASRVVQAREREALHVRAVPAQDYRVRRRVPHARRAAAPSARTSSSPTNRSKSMKVTTTVIICHL